MKKFLKLKKKLFTVDPSPIPNPQSLKNNRKIIKKKLIFPKMTEEEVKDKYPEASLHKIDK